MSVSAFYAEGLCPACSNVLHCFYSWDGLLRWGWNMGSIVTIITIAIGFPYLALNSTAKSWRNIREKIVHLRTKVLFGCRIRVRESCVSNNDYWRRGNHRSGAILSLNNSPIIMICFLSRGMISKCTLHAIGFIISSINISITSNPSTGINITVVPSTESFSATRL